MPDQCEVPLFHTPPEEIRAILHSARTFAIVGLSDKPDRDSYEVGAYLQKAGYHIIPVNPAVNTVLGEKAYRSLREVPVPVDVALIFRKPDAVPALVEEAIAIGATTVWMQEGIVHNAAAERARAAGLRVVMSRCALKEHAAWQRDEPGGGPWK